MMKTQQYGSSDAPIGCVLFVAFLGVALGGGFASQPVARGEGGDIAIFREATGTDSLAAGGDAMTHDWDTTERVDVASYSLVGGTGVLCKAGHHLVLYSTRFDDTDTADGERSEINSRLLLTGTAPAIGWSQGYTRRQQNDFELICAGGGIIMVENDDDAVTLFSERTDGEATRGLQRVANGSAIQLVKLDDNWDYCRLSRSSNQASPGTNFTDVTYDAQDELDVGSFAHANGSGQITFKTAGHYLVLANTYLQSSGAPDQRCGYVQRLTLDGVQVPGSLTTVFIRKNPNADSCHDGSVATAMIIETTGDNKILGVQCLREDADVTATILAGRTAITIAKLPDIGDYIRLDDTGTDNFNPGTATALGWDTEDEVDPCYTHNDSQIGVTIDDDYLFFCTLYCDDDGGERIKWWQRWRKNGSSIYLYGTTGRYSRNKNDNSGTSNKSGNRSGIIVDLVAGDYIESVSQQLGNGGTMAADVKGVQGVRLTSIFDVPDPNAPIVVNADQGATGIFNTSATLNGELMSTGGSATTLWVYYGTTDEGEVATNWEASAVFGTNMAEGAHSTNVTGLMPNTTYYYRFAASNATTIAWPPYVKEFKTLGPPTVTHDGGADTRVAAVSLSGELTDGTSAEAVIYWGRSDGGTEPGAWEHTNVVGSVNEGWFAEGLSWGQSLADVTITNLTASLTGSVVRVNDGWTVTGSGDDIWNTVDNCHYAYTQLTGDFDVYCRASDFTGGANVWRKGGLMARESLHASSMNAFIGRAPVAGENRITFQHRETNTAATVTTHVNGFTAPLYWLRLVREGDSFSGYWSDDLGGKPGNWTQMGSTQTIDMSAQVYVGLAATAHNNNELTSITFDKLGGLTSAVDEFLYGIEHHYRVYVTNAYGADWSDATERFHTEPPEGIGIVNETVTDVAPTSATFNGTLNATGSVFDVSVFWGTSDGGTDMGGWDHTNSVASCTNVGLLDVSFVATGLTSGVEYFYAFRADNAATNIWGEPSERFTTVSAPMIVNGSGALVDMASATLRGNFLVGGAGDVTVYWGTSDGGNNHTTWQHTNTIGQILQGAFETDTGDVAFYGLTYYYRCHVTNALGQDWSGVQSFESLAPNRGVVEVGTVEATDTWTTVALDQRYESPVVACVVNYDSNTIPVVVRVRNVAPTSFEVKLQNPRGSTNVMSDTVHYIAMAEGTNQLPDGRKIEAQRVLSNGTSWSTDWTILQQEQIIYGQAYDNPVVLGQVMTFADTNWSVFWSNDGAGNPVNSGNCYVGKHVGQDTNVVRGAETLGIIVVEAGTGTLDGVAYEADVGGATIQGVGDAPPYQYVLTSFSAAPEVGVACQTDMNGVDGGWAHLYGATSMTATAINLSVDEDQILDAERAHAAEPVCYWVFESALAYGDDFRIENNSPTAVSSNTATFHADVFIYESAFDVTVYWGPSDGGTNAGTWANTNHVGSFTNGAPVAVSFLATGLSARTNYYYTFMASNRLESFWGESAMMFSTLDEPRVDNLPVSDVAEGRATLNGELLAGGSADVTIYWGLSDGGTNKTAWDYSCSPGELINGTFAADTTNAAFYGTVYQYRCYATNAFGDDWADAPVPFTTPSPSRVVYLQDSGMNGIVSLEAEHYSRNESPRSGHWWELLTDGGASGGEAMQALPNSQTAANGPYEPNSPRLDFHVDFVNSGTHTVWVRGLAPTNPATGNNDSCHAGLDTNMVATADNIYGFNAAFGWSKRTMDNVDATLDVSGPGEHAVNIWMREDGFVCDKIVLTTNAAYVPTGIGPPESSLVPGLKLGIDNAAVTAVSTNAATCNGVLYATGSVFDVYVCWGTSDGGCNPGAWANTNYIGSYTNVSSVNVACRISGLLPGMQHYYTLSASNVSEVVWAEPSESFWTIGQPVVSNDPATGVTTASATLNGSLAGTYSADITIYWGLADGGSVPSAWANTNEAGTVLLGTFSSNVAARAGGDYYYRCYAATSVGYDWAFPSERFSTPAASLAIGDVRVTEGNAGTVDAVFAVSLTAPCASNVTVNYATVDGTAVAGADFAATSGVLYIPSGQTSTQITVSVNGNTELEPTRETFSLQLSGAVGCTIADGEGVGTIVDDDAAGYLADRRSHMKITLDGYAGSETLIDFPALVRFSESIPRFEYTSFTSGEGLDLVFVNADRTILLNHEIESWDTNGESCVWVQVTELPSGGTHIWAYWNNPSLLTNVIAGAGDIPDCVLWLKADEGVVTNGSAVAAWLDQSGRGHDVSQSVVSNQPVFVENVVDGKPVVRFTAGNEYLTRADALGFAGNAAMTVFMVVEAEDGATRRALHMGNTNGANQQTIGFATDSSFRYNNGNAIFASYPMTGGFGIGTWLTNVGDSYGAGRFFKDGGEKAQTGSTNPTYRKTLVDGETLIGQGRSNAGAPSDLFLGDIAEIIVYDRALSSEELNRVGYSLEQKYGLTTAYTPSADSFVAPHSYAVEGATWSAGYEGVWHMTEVNARDGTAYSRNGFASGTPTVTNGQIAGSVDFVDAAGDFVTVAGYKGVLGTGARTASAWIKTTDNQAAILSWGTDTQTLKWIFRVQSENGTNGAIRVEVNGGYNVGMTSVTDDQWHHVVATFADDGTPDVQDVLLYVDGVLDGSSASLTMGVNTTAGIDLRIASGHANRRHDGPIDEARVSSVARSADWIKACYENQKQGSTFARYTDVFTPEGMLLIVR